jgi:aspartate racemase
VADIELTISQAHISTLAPNVAARKVEEQADVFARHVDSLKAAGADVAVVTSIAAHFCIEELKKRSALPLINIIESLERYFSEEGIKRVGILGNELSMKSHLFGMIDSVEFVLPCEDQIGPVGQAYMQRGIPSIGKSYSRF